MAVYTVDGGCPESHRCPLIPLCLVEAISQVGYTRPTIDADKCVGCGKCAKMCPMGAVHPVAGS